MNTINSDGTIYFSLWRSTLQQMALFRIAMPGVFQGQWFQWSSYIRQELEKYRMNVKIDEIWHYNHWKMSGTLVCGYCCHRMHDSPWLVRCWCFPCSRCCWCSCWGLWRRPGGCSPSNSSDHRTSCRSLKRQCSVNIDATFYVDLLNLTVISATVRESKQKLIQRH